MLVLEYILVAAPVLDAVVPVAVPVEVEVEVVPFREIKTPPAI